MNPRLSVLPLLLACTKPVPPAIADAGNDLTQATPQTQAVPQAFAEAHMSAHYSMATAARDALFRGNLDAAQEPLRWLAEHDSHPGIPIESMPYVMEMKGAARVALNAGDVRGAAYGLATVATICGECHGALKTGPSFATPPPPDDREGVGWHMARHRWAADRMWEGMLQPNDTTWKLGVAALDEEPLQDDEVPSHEGLSEDETAVAEWLHEMGTFGKHMKTDGSKARYYGELLANCARCHSTAKTD